jgi:hypothetical protein
MGYKEGQKVFNVLLTNWQGEEDVEEYENFRTHCGKKRMSFFRSFCRETPSFHSSPLKCSMFGMTIIGFKPSCHTLNISIPIRIHGILLWTQ